MGSTWQFPLTLKGLEYVHDEQEGHYHKEINIVLADQVNYMMIQSLSSAWTREVSVGSQKKVNLYSPLRTEYPSQQMWPDQISYDEAVEAGWYS